MHGGNFQCAYPITIHYVPTCKICMWFSLAARCRTVCLSLSSTSMAALLVSSLVKASTCPAEAASMSGVFDFMSVAVMSAPLQL